MPKVSLRLHRLPACGMRFFSKKPMRVGTAFSIPAEPAQFPKYSLQRGESTSNTEGPVAWPRAGVRRMKPSIEWSVLSREAIRYTFPTVVVKYELT